ncbi:MAG TPA: glycosyltransferase family 39 protein, partial [Bryobacteraceae bacterium]|nr:glycosyltransferase family 39 protein [Bryobacteraceae bacterium]
MNKYVIGVIVLIGLAVARVASTYTVLNGTYDEPLHVACGMEWLRGDVYTCDIQHPPLARAALALGPYLKGLRLATAPGQRSRTFFDEGNAILYSGGQYWSNLTVARVGTLPFLVLLCVVTFLWTRRWFSQAAGFWAVLLLVCASPILGHAGLATNDVACAAGAALALYQFLRWLEEPRTARCLWWGFATAFAVLCKFSNIPFLLVCYAAGLMFAARGSFRRRLVQIGLAASVVLVLAWVTYRFHVNPPAVFYGVQQHPVIESMLDSRPLLHSVWKSVMTTPLPLAEAMIGVMDLIVHNAVGQDSYLLGQWSQSGWWYFFPVVLAVKTPIGLLSLAAVGLAGILRRRRERPWQQILTIVFPFAILLVCMPSRINLGVRHILPVYPLLAIIGGHAMTAM